MKEETGPSVVLASSFILSPSSFLQRDSKMPQPQSRRRGSAFTLIELLVVIGIIVVLISILIPVVARVRRTAQSTATKAFMSNLSQAIDTYNAEQHAYPGPLSNAEICNDLASSGWGSTGSPFTTFTADSASTSGFYTTGFNNPTTVTMAENLMLGLCGGLSLKIDASGNVDPTALIYDPTLVGNGANSLNIVGAKKHQKAYVELKNVIWRDEGGKKSGHWIDDGGPANDTIIPEFVDNYTDPMPILYLRARKGAHSVTGQPLSQTNNTVITYTAASENITSPMFRVGQFDLRQIIGYTGTNIGAGRKLGSDPIGWGSGPVAHGLRMDVKSINTSVQPTNPEYRFPYDAYPYFRNSSLSSPSETDSTFASGPRNDVPYGKDGYILISAGPDRVYGTRDDETSFGEAGPR
jgi:type II secretory pathway pseudopilin PulG